jgi:hypothetical protein
VPASPKARTDAMKIRDRLFIVAIPYLPLVLPLNLPLVLPLTMTILVFTHRRRPTSPFAQGL